MGGEEGGGEGKRHHGGGAPDSWYQTLNDGIQVCSHVWLCACIPTPSNIV